MAHTHAPGTDAAEEAAFPRWRRTVGFVSLGAGVAAFSMNFWMPFLPIYMQRLGAEGEAAALFWAAVAMSSNGVFRLLGGPFWGVLSDRYGRKVMYVRALYGATVTTLIAFVATEPWHLAAAMACQGFVSGFIPAAVALTSVSVPQSRLTGSLGSVQGAQYAGTTIGPALGAALAALLGMRESILIAALLPAAVATTVWIAVPRDRVAPRQPVLPGVERPGWWRSFTSLLGVQFALGMLLMFIIWAVSQLVRTAAPVAIGQIEGQGAATGATGIAFSIGGLASVVGALGVARWIDRSQRMRRSVSALIAVTAIAQAAMGLATSVWLFTALFAVVMLTQGAVLPATNTIIAASVPRQRRGTAFGIASSVQALSFIIGPMGAALFAAFSLQLGFLVLSGALALTAVTVFLFLREPDLSERPAQAGDSSAGRSPSKLPA
jgi:MFS transporter, DHA1 family, multidrug resistance protein